MNEQNFSLFNYRVPIEENDPPETESSLNFTILTPIDRLVAEINSMEKLLLPFSNYSGFWG